MIIHQRPTERVHSALLGAVLIIVGAWIGDRLLLRTPPASFEGVGWDYVMVPSFLAIGSYFLVYVSRRRWCFLELDERGVTMRRGPVSFHRDWHDITAVTAAKRLVGRGWWVRAVMIECDGLPVLRIDDIFAIRFRELASLLRQRCRTAGNAGVVDRDPDGIYLSDRLGWALTLTVMLPMAIVVAAMAAAVMHSHHH